MMDNKLSELSKPVAWTDERGKTCAPTENKERGLESRYRQDYEKYTTPFYSQEYVSALLAELEDERASREQWQQNCTRTEERIAELEAIRSDASQVFKEIATELGCNPDNESIMMAIDALKNRLATPVRLPRTLWYEHDDLAHEIPVLEKKKVVAEIRAAGFKVEGDA